VFARLGGMALEDDRKDISVFESGSVPEQLSRRHSVECIRGLGDAEQEAAFGARLEKAAHLGDIEELMPDVPNLELSHERQSSPIDHREVNLGRRPVPVGDRRRMAESNLAPGLGAGELRPQRVPESRCEFLQLVRPGRGSAGIADEAGPEGGRRRSERLR
jgi:hypothetical protein